jgi:hypothetical protein
MRPPQAGDDRRQPRQVFQHVKLPLVGPAQALAGVEAHLAGAGQPLHLAEARAVGGFQLLGQVGRLTIGRQKQVAVEPGKVAVYSLLPHNQLNLIDGCHVAFGRQPGAIRAEQVFQRGVPVIKGKGKVGRGAAGFAAGNFPIFQHQHLPAGFAQQVGRGEAGNAGAYYHYIRSGVFAQRLKRWQSRRGAEPGSIGGPGRAGWIGEFSHKEVKKMGLSPYARQPVRV